MSLLPIPIYGDPRLQQMVKPVVLTPDMRILAADTIETMYAVPGRGPVAPQAGVSLRMFAMDCHCKDGAEHGLSWR